MNGFVRIIRARIYEQATLEQATALRQDQMYGAPYSFFQRAFGYGYITREELSAVERAYGDLWHYRGD